MSSAFVDIIVSRSAKNKEPESINRPKPKM
jgi:hypothetical protein